MRLSKTTFLAALAVASLFAGGSAYGQDTTTKAPVTGASTNAVPRMSRSRPDIGTYLNLTENQKAQVQPILDAQRQKMRAVFQDSSLSADDKRTKLKDIREQTNTQMKSVLTPEQYQKWEAMQTRVRRMMAPTPAPAPGAPAPAAPPQQ